MRRLLTALAVLLAASSCSLVDTGDPSDSEGGAGAFLQTDAARYDARLLTDGLERVVFDVPYETRNPTAETLYIAGCRKPSPAVLEKRVAGAWKSVYAQIVQLCARIPPWSIAPGEARRDTLRVTGYLPGQNTLPTFDTDIGGTYRLRRMIHTALTDEHEPLDESLLPFEHRVSNTFEVREVE